MCARIYTIYACCGAKQEVDLILCPDRAEPDREPCDEHDGAIWELPKNDTCRACQTRT
jgi:hypothetical protein